MYKTQSQFGNLTFQSHRYQASKFLYLSYLISSLLIAHMAGVGRREAHGSSPLVLYPLCLILALECLEEGPWSLSSLNKEFSKETKIIKYQTAFTRSKVCVGKLGVVGLNGGGGLRLLTWGQFSGLPPASHLTCAHIWSGSGSFLVCTHISQPR